MRILCKKIFKLWIQSKPSLKLGIWMTIYTLGTLTIFGSGWRQIRNVLNVNCNHQSISHSLRRSYNWPIWWWKKSNGSSDFLRMVMRSYDAGNDDENVFLVRMFENHQKCLTFESSLQEPTSNPTVVKVILVMFRLPHNRFHKFVPDSFLGFQHYDLSALSDISKETRQKRHLHRWQHYNWDYVSANDNLSERK